MIAVYSKKNSRGKIIITKHIDCFYVDYKKREVTILYKKGRDIKSKTFAEQDKLLIKDGEEVSTIKEFMISQ